LAELESLAKGRGSQLVPVPQARMSAAQ